MSKYQNKSDLNLINFDPRLGWDYEIDSQRIRGDKVYSKAKPVGKFRILMLGDSYTYGNEVQDDENFPYYMERILPNVEVLNMGAGGYGMDQMVLKYKHHGKAYHPDLVIVGLFVGDFERASVGFFAFAKPKFIFNESSGAFHLKNVPVPEPGQMYVAIREEARPVSYIWTLIQKARLKFPAMKLQLVTQWYAQMSRLTEYLFSNLKSDVEAQGGRLAVVQIPAGERFLEPPFKTHGRSANFKVISDLGIPVIHLEQQFLNQYGRKKVEKEFYIHRANGKLGHLSPPGNRAAAEIIARHLCENSRKFVGTNYPLTCSFSEAETPAG